MLTCAAAVVATVSVSSVFAALFFLFEPTTAKPGDVVTIRTGGTPAGFTLAEREGPFRRAIRLYVVPNDAAATIRSRFDRRLHFIGSLVPDRNGRGILTFAAPPLDTGTYAVAAWCPGCATSSSGRTFFVLPIPEVSRVRDQLGLHIEMPAATQSCPVTKGRYGNGFLSTSVPGDDGVLVGRREADGTLFQKIWWLPRRGFTGALTVRGERMDALGRMTVLSVNWGYSSDGRGSWASAITFPSEGCWRLSGRVGDIVLTYVVRVVAG